MADLLGLLKQSQPKIATGQALLILDMQNDFILPNGRLPIADANNEFVEKIANLAASFRSRGDVIWVRSVFKAGRTVNDISGRGDRVVLESPKNNSSKKVGSKLNSHQNEVEISDASPPVSQIKSRMSQRASSARVMGALQRSKTKDENNHQKNIVEDQSNARPAVALDVDPELFLSENFAQQNGSTLSDGAGFLDRLKHAMLPRKDISIVKSHYSAFTETALLLTLRTKFITQLYVCGCFANLSVYATALDAAQHGFDIQLVEDCLISRSKSRHDKAIKQMVNLLGATKISSDLFVKSPVKEQKPHTNGSISDIVEKPNTEGKDESADTKELQDLMQSVKLNDKSDNKELAGHANNENDHKICSLNNVDKEQREQRVSPSSVPPESRNSYFLVPGQANMKDTDRSVSRTDKKETIGPEGTNLTDDGGYSVDEQQEENEVPIPTVLRKEASSREQICSLRSSNVFVNKQIKIANELVKNKQELKAKNNTDSEKLFFTRSSLSANSSDVLANTFQKANMSAIEPDKSSDWCVGEGDSSILFESIPPEYRDPTDSTKSLSDTIFSRLHQEVQWQKMYHVQGEVPRLVAVQGEISEDGSMPVYRHPSDKSPPLLHFSPTVRLVRETLQKRVNQPVNHVLIQLYRSGNDYISEHSDKTLDIVRGSSILNASFGAQRTMRLRTKKPLKDKQTEESPVERITQRVPMPHNSTFVLGEKTNMCWLHSITQDKRAHRDRSDAENAYEGSRISLTFRHIGTFLDSKNEHIWGQGATSKSSERRNRVVNGNKESAQEMINAFGTENRSSVFDWDGIYGAGFDVLHFYTNPPHKPMLFLSGNLSNDLSVLVCLKELEVPIEIIDAPITTRTLLPSHLGNEKSSGKRVEESETVNSAVSSNDRDVYYRDTDIHHTEVAGVQSILLYLDRYYHLDEATAKSTEKTLTLSRSCTARAYSYLSASSDCRNRTYGYNISLSVTSINDSENISRFLQAWEVEMKDDRPFAAGSCFTIADCLLWAQLHVLLQQEQEQEQEQHKEERERSQKSHGNGPIKSPWAKKYPLLKAYHDRLTERASVANVIREQALVQSQS